MSNSRGAAPLRGSVGEMLTWRGSWGGKGRGMDGLPPGRTWPGRDGTEVRRPGQASPEFLEVIAKSGGGKSPGFMTPRNTVYPTRQHPSTNPRQTVSSPTPVQAVFYPTSPLAGVSVAL